MKAILIETVLVSGSILFWAAALPAAVVFFPAAALWEKIAASCGVRWFWPQSADPQNPA